MKVVIIGGVAAGAGTAARLRRLDENVEIVMFERGPYISYANCGLPYYLGGVIEERDKLLLMTPEKFAERSRVDVRVRSEVRDIDRANKTVLVSGPDGREYRENYDKLVVATGSSPLVPPLPGIGLPAVHQLWTVPDMDGLVAAVGEGAKSAVVVGAGFIGLEVAENLVARGLSVTLVEMLEQVLPTLDREMTTPLDEELKRLGVSLELGRSVKEFRKQGGGIGVLLDNGRMLAADMAVMSVGVRPNSDIARRAGLEVGERGHIRVDAGLRTSDPDIYAAGDVIETADPILGGLVAVPLAGPANKQARIVADNLVGGAETYPGSYGASIVKVGEKVAASVGYNERRLAQLGVDCRKVFINAMSGAGYYPGAAPLNVKVVFGVGGRILGAQIVGSKGVDKRIDVIATAMHAGMRVDELAELELSYAPPFNSPRDPINIVGMVAENALRDLSRVVFPDGIPDGAQILDVREPGEIAEAECDFPSTIAIPLGALRDRIGELDKSRPVVIGCQMGARAYQAERLLRQQGFEAYNLSGGYMTWRLFRR